MPIYRILALELDYRFSRKYWILFVTGTVTVKLILFEEGVIPTPFQEVPKDPLDSSENPVAVTGQLRRTLPVFWLILSLGAGSPVTETVPLR